MAEQWLSIVEYARTFDISDMTIRRRIRTGRIQAYLRDGKYYIPVQSDPVTGELIRPGAKAKLSATSAPVKSHPSAEQTLPKVHHVPRDRSALSMNDDFSKRPPSAPNASLAATTPISYTQIPGRIASAVATEQEVSVEAKALLDYCNSSLATAKEIERHLEERYLAKLDLAKEQILRRDAEIAKLNQQIEDLQLLAQILEKKR